MCRNSLPYSIIKFGYVCLPQPLLGFFFLEMLSWYSLEKYIFKVTLIVTTRVCRFRSTHSAVHSIFCVKALTRKLIHSFLAHPLKLYIMSPADKNIPNFKEKQMNYNHITLFKMKMMKTKKFSLLVMIYELATVQNFH